MNHPQSYPNCDPDIKQYIDGLTELTKQELPDVVGVYLHGSLTMNSYYRPKSDIDVILVVAEVLPVDTRRSYAKAVATYSKQRPTTGDVELSVITAQVAKDIPNPTPFEVHASSEWYDKILNDEIDYSATKTDIDLLSHLTYVTQRGICLYGQPITEVFGMPNWHDFMASVIDDFEWIIADEHILETPFYSVLNICRVLQLLSEDTHQVHSKDEGGKWGLANLPEQFHPVIQHALDVYQSDQPVNEAQRRTGGLDWNKDELLALRDYARGAKI